MENIFTRIPEILHPGIDSSSYENIIDLILMHFFVDNFPKN